MQKKPINNKTLNYNLYNFSIINKYYLNKIFKDKNTYINYNFLNNYLLFFFANRLKNNKFISNFNKISNIKLNFFNKFNFILNKKNLTLLNRNRIGNSLYNISYLYKNNNKKSNRFKKIKFNKLLFLKKHKFKKNILFLNLLKDKIFFLLKNKKNIIDINNKIKIIIYKLINNFLYFKKKKNNIYNSKLFFSKLYFYSKKNKNIFNFTYKKPQKNNYRNIDYSFVKFYKNRFYNLINNTFIDTINNIGKKKILSFFFYLFKFISIDYYTKNKKLIAKNKLFLNIKKVRKLKRRVVNNFFYKKKLYLKRLNNKYYSSLTKHKKNLYKSINIKKTKNLNNFFYGKKKIQLSNLLKVNKLNKKNNNLYLKNNKQKLKQSYFLTTFNLKNNTLNIDKKNTNITNNEIINFFLLNKKLTILNYILRNFNRYNLFNYIDLYKYIKYFLANYNKKKYSVYFKKNINKKNFSLFYYNIYIDSLIDLYKQNYLIEDANIIPDLNIYNAELNSVVFSNIKKNNKLYQITCKYLYLTKYYNHYYNYNSEIIKNIKIFKKNTKNKYKKNKTIFYKKKTKFRKKKYNLLYFKYKKYLYINNNNIKIKYNYQVKSNLNYNLNYFLLDINTANSISKPLHIYYNITTKNTRYIILNSKFKIIKSNSLGLLNIDRREMRQKKSKIKLAEYFLKHLKIIIKKNKNLFNELHFHLVRHKYFTYLVFKLFRKYIKKKIKKIEKKKKNILLILL